MEEWQIQHIKKNLVSLIKATICNAELIARLQENKILAEIDVHSLEQLSNQFDRSKKLYEILPTRVDAYDVLMHSLDAICQSGAVKILKEYNTEYRNYGTIVYDKNHKLGIGRFGTVFKGTFGGKTEVAVKVVNTDLNGLEMAKKEIDFLKTLDEHENIVRYHFAETHDNYILIALELCLISLQDEVKLNMVNVDPIIILRKCTNGLAYLHKNNVIHRDLKPANVLLREDGQVKISDFGLSRQIPMGMSSVLSDTVGTLDWMAPELLQCIEENGRENKAKQSISADVFSLGCIFCFVLTEGSHPFGDIHKRQANIVDGKPQLENLPLHESWLHLIKTMIAHLPRERPSVPKILKTYFSLGRYCEDNTCCQTISQQQNAQILFHPNHYIHYKTQEQDQQPPPTTQEQDQQPNPKIQEQDQQPLPKTQEQDPQPRLKAQERDPQPRSSTKYSHQQQQAIANATVNKIRTCSLEYKNIMDARWKSSEDHRALRNLHDNTSPRTIGHLKGEEMEVAVLEVNSYFKFISELFEESHFQPPAASANKNCICVHFTDDGVQLGATRQTGGKNLGDEANTALVRARLTFKEKDTSLDFLAAFSSSSFTSKSMGMKNMKVMLPAVGKAGESLVVGKVDHIFIVIPTWLNLDQRTILRDMVHVVLGKKISFLNETSLAAYFMLCKAPAINGNILVGINVGICGVFIQAYMKSDDSQSIQLLAAAEYQWDTDSNKKKKKAVVGKLVTLFSTYGGASKNPKNTMNKQDNPVGILSDTYDKVMTRLELRLRLVRKHCFLLADSPMWWQQYENFLKIRSSQLVDVGEQVDGRFALERAIELSKQPQQIRNLIIDHPIIASVAQVQRVEDLKNKPASIPPASVEVPKQIPATTSTTSIRKKHQSVRGRVVKNEDVQRKELLDKCKEMQMQMENGNVRLPGFVTHRLVWEAIKKAQHVAQNASANEQVVLEQHGKLNDIIKMHKFHINV